MEAYPVHAEAPLTAAPARTIAIVGGGLSGTLLAVQLLRQARTPLRIHLLEREPRGCGRGVAYGTRAGCHLLNVPAGRMSAFPDDAGHFLAWAEARKDALLDPPWVPEVSATAFLPRRAYGDYLVAVLDAALRDAAPEVIFTRTDGEVLGLEAGAAHLTVWMKGGEALEAGHAVLALGNFPPGDPAEVPPDLARSGRYHGNPWAPGLLEALLDTRSCLLVGSGLTMADWATALSQAGYGGRIHVLSRRGLWPHAHRPVAPIPLLAEGAPTPETVRGWLRLVRGRVAATGGDWRGVVDALRPLTQGIWRDLPLDERRRFLRHLRPYWDCHRHRLAPPVAEHLAALLASGRLVRHAGRILGLDAEVAGVAVNLRPRGSAQVETLRVGAVVNCAGSESDYRKLESPLVRSLLDRGLIVPDALALGLQAGADGALVGADGRPSSVLSTLGPPQKGVLWETTAVPEIRLQAQRLAARLLAPGV